MLNLNLIHLFSAFEGNKVVCYCKDALTEKFYKVINSGVVGHIQESIKEITELDFRRKMAERMHIKRQLAKGMGTAYSINFNANNEITFGLDVGDSEAPQNLLNKEIQKSLKYSYEDADFYAKSLLREAFKMYYGEGENNV